MKEILISTMPALLWAMTGLNLLFMCLLFDMYRKTEKALPLLMAFVAFGLFYDALMLSLGSFCTAH